MSQHSTFDVLIEIPANSNVKYEIKEDGSCYVDRFLSTCMHYPCEYGYIPKTLAEDGDPVDVMVVCPQRVVPGSIIKCRTIGVFRMKDEAGDDHKLIAVPVSKVSAMYDEIQEAHQLPKALREQIAHFFKHYKDLESNKWVEIGDWGTAAEAGTIIEQAFAAYGK